MDSLFLGVLIAYGSKSPSCLEIMRRRRLLIAGLFVIVLIAGPIWFDSNPLNASNKGWVAILWSAFLLVVLSGNAVVVGLLRMPLLVRIGLVSYSVYLFHQPVNGLLHGIFRHHTPYQIFRMEELLVSVIALVLTLVLAALLYHGIEKPFIRMGHRLSYRNPSQPGHTDSSRRDLVKLSF